MYKFYAEAGGKLGNSYSGGTDSTPLFAMTGERKSRRLPQAAEKVVLSSVVFCYNYRTWSWPMP